MVTNDSLRKSFSRVKEDISRLQAQMMELTGQQAELMQMLQGTRQPASMDKPKSKPKAKKTAKKKKRR